MKRTQEVVASVTIYNAPNYTASGRQEIASWLRQQAKYVANKRTAQALNKTYRARYMAPARRERGT